MAKFDREKDHYSLSQVKVFTMCQYKYFLQYVKKLPYCINYSMVSGRALHAGLEENNLDLLEGAKGLTTSEIVEVAVTEYEEETEGLEDFDLDIDQGKDKLVKEITPTTKKYLEEVQPQLLEDGLVSAEEEIVLDVCHSPFIGYIDVTTEEMLFDYKTLSRRKSKQEINYDPQLVVYEKASGKQGGFVQLMRGKDAAEIALPQRTKRTTKKIWTWVRSVVTQIKKAKKSGDFLKCDPTSWVCNKCPFRFKCFYRN